VAQKLEFLIGPPGTGKTHLAIGLGIEVIQKDFKVVFSTIGKLVQLLKTEEYIQNSKV
jgi:DNA replication protein DnaC